MPPRKRAQAAPKPDPEETDGPVTDDETPPAAEQDSDGASPDGDTEATPEQASVETDSEPCGQCFPGGWAARADIVGALGCEHGTWQRHPAH